MKIRLLGGLHVEHDGRVISVGGAMQLAVFFRLAIDAGSAVSYRSIAEDVWSADAPENARAALQSIVSRLRAQLPPGVIESTPGGYRIAVTRADVDALAFEDLVAAASVAPADVSADLATEALALWRGEPWIPSDNFDWFARDLLADRATALALGGVALASDRATTIPAPLTGLVGRESELRMIDDQLVLNRLVTILGTGGAGKTRLAIESARMRPGAILVELAPVGSTEVLSAVLAATGREIRTSDSTTDNPGTRGRVLESLAGRDVLLVLDNCEHVIGAAAALVVDLLGALPQLRVLTTSREPLGVPGEAFVPIGSLSDDRALELFAERALSATGAPLSAGDRELAAQICGRLDGLPLPIELAAARLRVMSVSEVLEGLEDRFGLLTGGFRTALPHHQTLRAMIDWSWSLLSSDERVALSRVAVYPAGAAVADAGELARSFGLGSSAVFDALVDRSLLQRVNGRYRELETIREYGIERLAEQGALAEARANQVQHMVDGAAHHDELLRGPAIHDALAWFDAEDDNVAAALRFAVESGMANEALSLVTSCFWYWTIRDREADSRAWLGAIGPLAGQVDSEAARLVELISPVVAAFGEGEEPGSEPDAQEFLTTFASLPLFEVTAASPPMVQLVVTILRIFAAAGGREDWMACVQVPRGEDIGLSEWPTAVLSVMRAAIAQNRGDVEELGEASEAAMQQFEAIGDLWGLALAQQMRAEWLSAHGRLSEGLAVSDASTDNMRRITTTWDLAQQRSLSVSLLIRMGRTGEAADRVAALVAEGEASGNIRAITQVRMSAAVACAMVGDAPAARVHLERFDELSPSMPRQARQLLAWAEAGRGSIAILEGDYDAAERALRQAIELAVASGDHPVMGSVALDVGKLALARGDVNEALRALDLATAIIGTRDPTDLRVIAIEQAAGGTAVGRTDTVPTRPTAVESLRQLVP